MPNPTIKMEKVEMEELSNFSAENNHEFASAGMANENGIDLAAENPTDPLEGGPCPFDDPVERTRCLVQYIRLRNQRAEAELAKRNAIKKQKMDAQATLQNTRDELAQVLNEQRIWERKSDDLNRERHEVLNNLKALHQKEIERKRQREEAERQRRLMAVAAEEQQRIAAAAALAAAQQQQQSSTLDAYYQLKQAQQYLNSLIASAGTGNSQGANATTQGGNANSLANLSPSLAQLLLSSMAVSTASGGGGGSSTSQLLAAATQQQQRSSAPSVSSQSQQYSTGQLTQQSQQQQVQNAVANLIRQHFPSTVASSSLPSFQQQSNQQTSASATYAAYVQQQQQLEQLQTQLANAAAAQQLPSGLTIQTALAAAAAAAATPSASILPSPNSATAAQLAAAIPNLSSDLIYQAALLAAANTIGANPSNLSTGQQQSQQQQQNRHK